MSNSHGSQYQFWIRIAYPQNCQINVGKTRVFQTRLFKSDISTSSDTIQVLCSGIFTVIVRFFDIQGSPKLMICM